MGPLINTCASLHAEQDELLHEVHVTPPFRLNDTPVEFRKQTSTKTKTHFFKNAVCIKSLFFF